MQAEKLVGPRYEISREEDGFPASLNAIAQPPSKLYLIGNPDALQAGLAVVGARKATPYGKGCARRFSRIAAEKGVCIISGGARGCDSEAHRAAIEANGKTVVFLGGGCDRVYPPEHVGLFQDVIDAGGAVVSEHPWGFKPLPYTFRARNRLIAGLAEAVLIVEAGLPSGTFTADDALSAGKEVLVVPGAITSKTSQGANRLLYQGALPVVDDESFEDILFTLLSVLKRPGLKDDRKECAEFASPVISAILAAPSSPDELLEVAVAAFGPEQARAKMAEELALAEAKRVIARQPDGRWGPAVQG